MSTSTATGYSAEGRGLDAIHAAIPADHGMKVFTGLTVIPEDIHLLL